MSSSNPESPRTERSERPFRPAAPDPVRPARPAAPSPRTPGVLVDATVVPKGHSLAEPGLSGIQSLRPSQPKADPEAVRQARSQALIHTALPSCLLLGVTLPLAAGGWFMLDRFSVIRDNGLGITLPIALVALGVFFLIATALLWVQLRRPTPSAAPN